MLSAMLSPLLRRPLFCLALLWAGGIVLATHLPLLPTTWALVAAASLGVWLLLNAAPAGRMALALAVVALSAALTAWHAAPPAPGDPRYLPPGKTVFIAYPLQPTTVTAYGWHAPMRLVQRAVNGRWEAAAGDVYLYGRGLPPTPGVYLQVDGRVQTTTEAGNPYDFSWRAYLAERGMTYRVRAAQVRPLTTPAPASRLAALRTRLCRAQIATLPPKTPPLYGHLLEGLVLGIHGSPLSETLTDQFRRAGTIHLMVVSGSQITLLLSFLAFPMLLLPRGRVLSTYPRLRALLLLFALPILAAYVAVADRGPSVDRAVLMGLLVALSVFLTFSPLALRRSYRPDMLTLLAAAALALLVSRPALLFSPSMQLSFAAVFGLCTIAPVLMRLLHRSCGKWALIPAATLGAQIMTYPVLAWHFGVIPLLAPFTNLIAVPLVGLLMPIGLLTFVTASLLPPLALLLNAVNVLLLKGLLWVSLTAARCPWAEVPWHLRSPAVGVLYLACVGLTVFLLSRWLDTRAEDWDVPAGREPRMW